MNLFFIDIVLSCWTKILCLKELSVISAIVENSLAPGNDLSRNKWQGCKNKKNGAQVQVPVTDRIDWFVTDAKEMGASGSH